MIEYSMEGVGIKTFGVTHTHYVFSVAVNQLLTGRAVAVDVRARGVYIVPATCY